MQSAAPANSTYQRSSNATVAELQKEQRMDPVRRKKRVVNSGAGVGVSFVVAWAIGKYLGPNYMPTDIAMIVGTLVGSLITALAACYNDLRGLLLEWANLRLLGERRTQKDKSPD